MSTLALRDYQRLGVQFLREHKRGAGLFLDMGLGKTAISLSALEPRHLPALVVAPAKVAENVWDEEVQKWRPDLTVGVAVGRPAQRAAVLDGDYDIITLGRDNLADVVALAATGKFNTLILDELSGFKTRGTNRWKAARLIAKHVKYVWGLTGTPSPNGLMDLWAQVFLLDGGERLEKTLGSYRARYFTPGRQLPNGVITEWHLRPGAAGRIHRLLEDLCLSMDTAGKVDLPPVTHNEIDVPLPTRAKKIYKEMRDTLVADMGLLGGEVHTAANAAVLSSKLAQISAGILYVDNADIRGGKYQVLHREKIKAVQDIVEGTGSPVLVFYQYRAELELLQEAFGEQLHTPTEKGFVQRWNEGRIPILAAHPASIGHGLNLQYGGHTIVWLSHTWSLEEYQQANKRLARSGQKNPVVIHHLLSPGTVDRAMLARLTGKASVQQALTDHLASPL